MHAVDHALAQRHAPYIRFDRHEPFFPTAAGYTIFWADGPSPSFPRDMILPPGAVQIIEYAIWWDWDIQHLYELEHIWIYLDADENIIRAEASRHGGYALMANGNDAPPLEGGHLTLVSEPGKHAFAPAPQWHLDRAERIERLCRVPGRMGVHVPPLFEEALRPHRTPIANRLVLTYLSAQAFQPTFDFTRLFKLDTVTLLPWEQLRAWIPDRVTWWIQRLHDTIPAHEQQALHIARCTTPANGSLDVLEAIRETARTGAEIIEMDVCTTADDVLVIPCDASLRQAPAGDEMVVTVDGLVDVCIAQGVGLYLNVEHLPEEAIALLLDELVQRGFTDYAIFGSSQPDILIAIKSRLPNATTAIRVHLTHEDPVLLAQTANSDYVHLCQEEALPSYSALIDSWLRRAHAAGLGIIGWQTDRPEDIAAFRALGIDAIYTSASTPLRDKKDG